MYVYFYLIAVIVRAYMQKRTGSFLMLIGGLIFIVTILNDYLFFLIFVENRIFRGSRHAVFHLPSGFRSLSEADCSLSDR